MVAEAGGYPWSSFSSNALRGISLLVTKHEVYRLLGTTAQTRQAVYRALYDEGLGEDALGHRVEQPVGGERAKRRKMKRWRIIKCIAIIN